MLTLKVSTNATSHVPQSTKLALARSRGGLRQVTTRPATARMKAAGSSHPMSRPKDPTSRRFQAAGGGERNTEPNGLAELLVGRDLVQPAEAVVHEDLLKEGVVLAAVDVGAGGGRDQRDHRHPAQGDHPGDDPHQADTKEPT